MPSWDEPMEGTNRKIVANHKVLFKGPDRKSARSPPQPHAGTLALSKTRNGAADAKGPCMRFNFLRIYFQIGDQSKLCISRITALGPKHISQWWYDGKTLPIHSQLKTLKSYASCEKMLQRTTVSFTHPLITLSFTSDLNRHDLPLYSPSFLCLWTWKLPSFPDMRINSEITLINTEIFGKTVKPPSI